MASRHEDWFKQAVRDLRHAETALQAQDYEWACFAAQQAAAKAIKAVFQKQNGEAWGHSLTVLLNELAEKIDIDPALIDLAKELDKHYIPARYPNGFVSGAPMDYYTENEAKRAIAHAEKILEFCKGLLR